MNIVSSFSFDDSKKPVVEEFTKIAERDGKDRSKLIMELIEEHTKNHSAGNSTFKLDQFQDPGFKAMPATMSSKDQWNEYIRKHMDKKERRELGERAKFMLTIIEAANWIESKK